MLRVTWRELETGSRTSLAGHEGGNPGYRQGLFYRVTAPALDPTKSIHWVETGYRLNILVTSGSFVHVVRGGMLFLVQVLLEECRDIVNR